MDSKFSQLTNLDELEAVLKDGWKKVLTNKLCESLYGGLTFRFDDLIATKVLVSGRKISDFCTDSSLCIFLCFCFF